MTARTARLVIVRVRGATLAVVLLGLLVSPAFSGPGTALATAEAATAEVETEAVDTTEESCGFVPGVIGDVCEGVGDIMGDAVGAVVGGGADAVLQSMVGFVVQGAGWLLGQLTTFINTSTSPDLQSDWFRAAYRDMTIIGMLGLLPFLLLAIIQALARQDAALMLRATFGYVPLAAIGTAGAIVAVDLLVRLTDHLTAWVGRSLGTDLSTFATGVGSALVRTSSPQDGTVIAGFAALIGAVVVAFAAFVIWLELLLRQAAIYVAVLFFPLGFMAMVWPATAHWVRRLTQGLVAIILSKFVIVAVMALATSALDADVADEGFSVVVAGGALLSLAALAPYVLLRLIPVFDAGMSSQLEGTFRRPTAAVGTPVKSGQMTGMIRQRAKGGGPGPTATPVPAARGGGGSAAGAASAGATIVALGENGARSATRAVRSSAQEVGADVAAVNGSPGSSTPTASPTRPSPNGRPSGNGKGTSPKAARPKDDE